MPTPPPTLLDRCRALRACRPGRAATLALALVVFATQLLLQLHASRHELLPGVHQVCEQCVVAEHSAPPPADAPVLASPAFGFVPLLAAVAPTLSRAPLVVRNRAPPVLA